MPAEAALLIRGARVFAPEELGARDVLVAGGRVVAIEPQLGSLSAWPGLRQVDARGSLLLPGLVDGHIHPLGGGGDGGPHTRNRDVLLGELTTAGVTTIVGMLGTDCETRSMRDLLAKTRALELEGISAWCTTGGYPIPPPTFSGSVATDLTYLDRVVGFGELAISDHRSSQPTVQEIARLVAAARMGGRLAGKRGTSVIHLGDGRHGLEPLRELADCTDLPRDQVLPTHVNRSEGLFVSAMRYAHEGGLLDITASISPRAGFGSAVDPAVALELLHAEGVPLERVSMSSDSNGNMPIADGQGGTRLSHHPPRALYDAFREAVGRGVPLAWALTTVTRNPAALFSLHAKGRVAAGADADLLVVDEALALQQVYARGQLMVDGGQPIVRGTFEGEA
jgi:beta-aspartyl-dipeptidase (metallo-type)